MGDIIGLALALVGGIVGMFILIIPFLLMALIGVIPIVLIIVLIVNSTSSGKLPKGGYDEWRYGKRGQR